MSTNVYTKSNCKRDNIGSSKKHKWQHERAEGVVRKQKTLTHHVFPELQRQVDQGISSKQANSFVTAMTHMCSTAPWSHFHQLVA